MDNIASKKVLEMALYQYFHKKRPHNYKIYIQVMWSSYAFMIVKPIPTAFLPLPFFRVLYVIITSARINKYT